MQANEDLHHSETRKRDDQSNRAVVQLTDGRVIEVSRYIVNDRSGMISLYLPNRRDGIDLQVPREQVAVIGRSPEVIRWILSVSNESLPSDINEPVNPNEFNLELTDEEIDELAEDHAEVSDYRT